MSRGAQGERELPEKDAERIERITRLLSRAEIEVCQAFGAVEQIERDLAVRNERLEEMSRRIDELERRLDG